MRNQAMLVLPGMEHLLCAKFCREYKNEGDITLSSKSLYTRGTGNGI